MTVPQSLPLACRRVRERLFAPLTWAHPFAEAERVGHRPLEDFMNWQNDSTQLAVDFGLVGTLLGVVVRFFTHSDVAVLVGAVGGLLVAFLLAALRGEQV